MAFVSTSCGPRHRRGNWIGRFLFHPMAAAPGGFGLLVAPSGEIRPALEAAFAPGKAAWISVMADPTAVRPGFMTLADRWTHKD